MKNYKYNVSLRSGLSLNAKVLKVLKEGFKDLDSAKDFALKYAADPLVASHITAEYSIIEKKML